MDDDKRTTRIDPNIASLLSSLRPKGKDDKPTDADKLEQERLRHAARVRVHIDIDPEIKERVQALADNLDVPVSQVYNFLVWYSLEATGKGEIDLSEHKYHSDSPKKKFNLKIPVK